MADDFICEGCGYPSAMDEKNCPFCGGRMVKINDMEQDLAYSEAYNDEADADVDSGDDFDFDMDEMPRAA